MTEFKAREEARQKAKAEELAPYIRAALARKKRMAPLRESEIPSILAGGLRSAAGDEQRKTNFSDRALAIPSVNPHT